MSDPFPRVVLCLWCRAGAEGVDGGLTEPLEDNEVYVQHQGHERTQGEAISSAVHWWMSRVVHGAERSGVGKMLLCVASGSGSAGPHDIWA